MLVPSRIIDEFDQENREVVIISSAIKLIVGGRATVSYAF